VHHAEILVKQDMTVKHKSTCNRWITEIHAHLDAVVGMTRPFPEGNLDRVAQILMLDRLPVHFRHQEMDLMHVKRMRLEGMVFDHPVFYRSHVSRDHWLLVGFENLLLLSVNRNVELNRAVRPAEFLGKVEFPLRGRFLKRLMHHAAQPIFLILDGGSYHHSRLVKDYVASLSGKLRLFFLSPYSPELNPDEQVWNHVKHHGVAKAGLRNAKELRRYVLARLRSLQRLPWTIRMFFLTPDTQYASA
jgi:transposase